MGAERPSPISLVQCLDGGSRSSQHKTGQGHLEIWLVRMYHWKLNFSSLEPYSLSLGLRLASGNSGLGRKRRRVARTKENSEAVVVGKGVEVARTRPWGCIWQLLPVWGNFKPASESWFFFFLMRVLYKKGSHLNLWDSKVKPPATL